MSNQEDLSRLPVSEFAARFQPEMVPLTNNISYFCAALSFSEEDVREYLHEPVAALPPAIVAALPKTLLLLVPYLEKPNGKQRAHGHAQEVVSLEKPAENRSLLVSRTAVAGEAALFFAIRDQEVAEYHYNFYRALAGLMSDCWSEEVQTRFCGLLREELSAGVHGEADEDSWRLKQALLRRQTRIRTHSKVFRDYARQSFIDTLTLYLHGICCDIDVDTGPRQLPSRHLRRRLVLLETLYPPPEGYAVFPEELK